MRALERQVRQGETITVGRVLRLGGIRVEALIWLPAGLAGAITWLQRTT